MIKKWICTLFAISLLGVLAACSSQSADSGTAAGGASSEQASASKEEESGTDKPGGAGSYVSFETTDLDGNIVRSSDIS